MCKSKCGVGSAYRFLSRKGGALPVHAWGSPANLPFNRRAMFELATHLEVDAGPHCITNSTLFVGPHPLSPFQEAPSSIPTMLVRRAFRRVPGRLFDTLMSQEEYLESIE